MPPPGATCTCVEAERRLREQWQRDHEQLHARDREALQLARVEADRQFHLLNDLRKEVLTDRAALVQNTVSKEVWDREHTRVLSDLRALREQHAAGLGERRGLTLGWQALIGVIGVAASVALLLNAIRLLRAGL
ncbi:MAG: hypothetical protein OEW98_00280 [Betaproteobacteria bacterium]|nr:hypothetical protein [Betaproteobacteria bacterium]